MLTVIPKETPEAIQDYHVLLVWLIRFAWAMRRMAARYAGGWLDWPDVHPRMQSWIGQNMQSNRGGYGGRDFPVWSFDVRLDETAYSLMLEVRRNTLCYCALRGFYDQ